MKAVKQAAALSCPHVEHRIPAFEELGGGGGCGCVGGWGVTTRTPVALASKLVTLACVRVNCSSGATRLHVVITPSATSFERTAPALSAGVADHHTRWLFVQTSNALQRPARGGDDGRSWVKAGAPWQSAQRKKDEKSGCREAGLHRSKISCNPK